MGGCSNSRKESVQKFRAGALKALGTKPMRWRWGRGWQLTGPCRLGEGPCRLLEGLPLGRNSVGRWQSFYGLWLLRCVKARIHPLKAATLLVPCTPLPSSTAKLGSSGTAFAVFLHSLRAPPTGCPVVFPTLNSTPTHAFYLFI